MSSFKIKKRENPYSQIDNVMINDRRLTPACVGLMTYMLSLQDEHVPISDIYKRFSIEYFLIIDDAIETLKECGYIDSNEDYITIK